MLPCVIECIPVNLDVSEKGVHVHHVTVTANAGSMGIVVLTMKQDADIRKPFPDGKHCMNTASGRMDQWSNLWPMDTLTSI